MGQEIIGKEWFASLESNWKINYTDCDPLGYFYACQLTVSSAENLCRDLWPAANQKWESG